MSSNEETPVIKLIIIAVLSVALALVTSERLRIGVQVIFEECNFTENSVVEVGGALGVGFNLPSASQEEIRPVEIRDW